MDSKILLHIQQSTIMTCFFLKLPNVKTFPSVVVHTKNANLSLNSPNALSRNMELVGKENAR
jgi:hypothetical protein